MQRMKVFAICLVLSFAFVVSHANNEPAKTKSKVENVSSLNSNDDDGFETYDEYQKKLPREYQTEYSPVYLFVARDEVKSMPRKLAGAWSTECNNGFKDNVLLLGDTQSYYIESVICDTGEVVKRRWGNLAYDAKAARIAFKDENDVVELAIIDSSSSSLDVEGCGMDKLLGSVGKGECIANLTLADNNL